MKSIHLGYFRFIISIISGITLFLLDQSTIFIWILIIQILITLLCISESESIKYMTKECDTISEKLMVLTFDMFDVIILEWICIYFLVSHFFF
jgi:hypothetical protein